MKSKDLDDILRQMNGAFDRMDDTFGRMDGVFTNVDEQLKKAEASWEKLSKGQATPAIRFTARSFTARLKLTGFFLKKALGMFWWGTCIIHIRKP